MYYCATKLAARDVLDTATKTSHVYNECASKLGVPSIPDTTDINVKNECTFIYV